MHITVQDQDGQNNNNKVIFTPQILQRSEYFRYISQTFRPSSIENDAHVIEKLLLKLK